MNQQIASVSASQLSAEPLDLETAFRAHLRVPLTEQGLSPALRTEGVIPFAVRNELRRPPLLPWAAYLQKWAGAAITAVAWVSFLWGLANLVLAAVHNQAGELGLGLDSTMNGAKFCLASFIFAGIGLPHYVIAARKLRQS